MPRVYSSVTLLYDYLGESNHIHIVFGGRCRYLWNAYADLLSCFVILEERSEIVLE